MRNAIIGAVIGVVAGVVVGATVVAPRLVPASPSAATGTSTEKEALTPARPRKAPPAEEPATSVAAVPVPAVPAPAAPPRQPVRWKMASAFAGSLPQIGTLAKRLESESWRVSGGNLEIKFHEPGTLVPPLEMFDAVASGAIDAAFSSPGLWADKVPALQLFSAVPFGPGAGEYLAWIYFGGGGKLFEEITHKHGIHGLFCGIIAPEASGWFREEIRVVEDLRGLKMRFPGLGGKVMAKLGAEIREFSAGDIFAALEAGDIDAAEFSMPSIDLKLGFHRMVKHYYFPGWHQPATLFSLMVNQKKWEELSATAKARIASMCGDNIRYGIAEGEALQFAALKEMSALGVKIHRLPTEILEALESAWREVAAEEEEADADFKRVWRSLSAFREDYAIWNELGRP